MENAPDSQQNREQVMERVRFGRTELTVPRVGLGTWAHGGPNKAGGRPVGWFGTDYAAARDSLIRAFENGIDHWDTADVYGQGRAERLIGTVWGDVPRDRVLLASKVGWDPGSYGHYYHPEQIRRQLESSLRNLQTDWIDVFYLHHCDFGPNDRYLDDAVAILQRYREKGDIHFIGLSDWKSENILRVADRVDPDVVQCYRNVVDDTYESSGLKSWVDDHDAGVAFFSPLKHSLLLGLYEGPVTFGNGDHRNALSDFRDFGLISRLAACRQELESRFADRAQPVLHGLLGALMVDAPTGCALVGQRVPSHVDAAAAVTGPFDASEAAWVRRLYQTNGRPTRASWKTYRQS